MASDSHNPLSPRSILSNMVVGLAVTVIGGVIVYYLTQARDSSSVTTNSNKLQPAASLPSVTARAENNAFEIIPERAECDQVTIRVVIAVTIRDAKRSNAGFFPVAGYFVDPSGKRYPSQLTTMDNKPLDPADVQEIKRGETFRYCLGPAEFLEIGMGADCPIKRLTVYLDSLPSKQVDVVEGWWPR